MKVDRRVGVQRSDASNRRANECTRHESRVHERKSVVILEQEREVEVALPIGELHDTGTYTLTVGELMSVREQECTMTTA